MRNDQFDQWVNGPHRFIHVVERLPMVSASCSNLPTMTDVDRLDRLDPDPKIVMREFGHEAAVWAYRVQFKRQHGVELEEKPNGEWVWTPGTEALFQLWCPIRTTCRDADTRSDTRRTR